MTRFESWALYLSTGLVGVTGLVYAWMLYLRQPIDSYSVLNHPWQGVALHTHVWVAPFFIFAIGLIWRDHIWKHFSTGRRSRRRTGIALIAFLLPMVASGYLIQTSVNELWRSIWIGTHLATSLAFLVGFVAHRLVPLRTKARSRRARAFGPAAAGRDL